MSNKSKSQDMKKIHISLNPYYKNLIDHPEIISPRLEGEPGVSIVRMGIEALLVQERNRMKEMENTNEKGESGKATE